MSRPDETITVESCGDRRGGERLRVSAGSPDSGLALPEVDPPTADDPRAVSFTEHRWTRDGTVSESGAHRFRETIRK